MSAAGVVWAALLIPADEQLPVRQVTHRGLGDLQQLVGGWIEEAPVPGRQDIVLWVNEEGLLRRLPGNRRATLLWGRLAGYPWGTGLLVGDAVLAGVTAGGDDTDLADIEGWLRQAADVAVRA